MARIRQFSLLSLVRYYRRTKSKPKFRKTTGVCISYSPKPDIRSLDAIQTLNQLGRRGLKGSLKHACRLGISGIWRTAELYRRKSRVNRQNQKYDKLHEVDTWRAVAPGDLETDSANKGLAEIYFPSPETTFHFMLKQLKLDYSEFTFVDFGAGKGKALLMAADYPFKKIIGIEFARNLYQVARSNIAHYKSSQQRCFDIDLVLEDACNVILPEGKCLLFLYAPFFGPVLGNVLENIRTSLTENPREAALCFIDDDVPDSLIEQVDEIIREWGLFTRHQAMDLPSDPGALIPMAGTFWLSNQGD